MIVKLRVGLEKLNSNFLLLFLFYFSLCLVCSQVLTFIFEQSLISWTTVCSAAVFSLIVSAPQYYFKKHK